MTTATAPRPAAGNGLFRAIAILGLVLAAAALLLLVAGPVGWRGGWLDYRLAFSALLPYAGYCGIAAMAVSLLALVFGGRRIVQHGLMIALLGLVVGGGVTFVVWHYSSLRGVYPRINDITTDFDNPPLLDFATPMRQAERGNPVAYGGAETAAVKQKSYPDIAPAMLDLPAAQAFDRALAVAQAKGWSIVKSDAATGVIDADARSRFFGFTDDIAIRVTPTSGGSRVDIRSGSRQGRGDFGVNAGRVRGFLAALKGGTS